MRALRLLEEENLDFVELPDPAPPEGDVFYVLLCRVCLGHFVRTRDGATNLDDASQAIFANKSKRELSAIPGADPPGTPYHSVLVEKGGKVKRHREFICMHSDQTYPEYLVAYTREQLDEGPPQPPAHD